LIFRFSFRYWLFGLGRAPGCLCSLFGGFVVGSSSTVALDACRHKVVELVASSSINLYQVIGLGGRSAFAPMA